jgi:hypothetical protein
MEYQKKAGQKMWSVVDFVKNGTLMSLYRDISEVRNEAGLYNEFYYGKENKKNTFAEIVDLLEEQEFPENWFETKFDRMDEVIENIVELLEVDAEQFELYVRSFENQVWFKAKKVVVEESESESDSDGDEDSGQGAVEDSDDEDEGTNGEFCGKCENYRYQYDILESKEKWEKRIKSYGATPCECEKEDEELRTCEVCDKDKYCVWVGEGINQFTCEDCVKIPLCDCGMIDGEYVCRVCWENKDKENYKEAFRLRREDENESESE